MSYENDAYMAEQFNDGLRNDFDNRSEDIGNKQCESCEGEGRERLSDCCAAEVLTHNICDDCQKKCTPKYYDCEDCNGEGEI